MCTKAKRRSCFSSLSVIPHRSSSDVHAHAVLCSTASSFSGALGWTFDGAVNLANLKIGFEPDKASANMDKVCSKSSRCWSPACALLHIRDALSHRITSTAKLHVYLLLAGHAIH
jgi:hypothetical protein